MWVLRKGAAIIKAARIDGLDCDWKNTIRNLGLGGVFFSDVFKFATISGILWRFIKMPLKSEILATFF